MRQSGAMGSLSYGWTRIGGKIQIMGFDLYLAPGSGFLDWDDAQWDAYLNQNPEPESLKLGNARYYSLAIESIVQNLEGGRRGCRFPLLARAEHADVPGWYNNELADLAKEIRTIRAELPRIAVNRTTLMLDSDEEVEELKRSFRGRPVNNLFDVCRHFIETFEAMIQRARETGQGLWLSY